MRTERAVSGVLIQEKEVSSGAGGKPGQRLFGQRGLAGAGVAGKQKESGRGRDHERNVFKFAAWIVCESAE
jgi:hypothetical protein